MSRFTVGRYDRAQAGLFSLFCPIEAVDSIQSVDPVKLVERGKKLVLLDVDNTLLRWRESTLPDTTREWIRRGHEAGLHFCLVSNTRNVARLKQLAQDLDVRSVRGRFKPSRAMYELALKEFGVEAKEAIMIGDQLMTDIVGANRSGIEAILVRPMHHVEFFGTKFNRFVERLILGRLRSIMAQEDDDLPIVRPVGIFERRIVRQFAKFCIVGGSSFLIDAGLHRMLMFNLHSGTDTVAVAMGRWVAGYTGGEPYDVGFASAKVVTASFAILNSFIWNRRWTFGIRGKDERTQQLARFLVVSLIGLLLNVVVSSAVNAGLPHGLHKKWTIATIVAAAVVAVWNFSGQRLWAFRRKEHNHG